VETSSRRVLKELLVEFNSTADDIKLKNGTTMEGVK